MTQAIRGREMVREPPPTEGLVSGVFQNPYARASAVGAGVGCVAGHVLVPAALDWGIRYACVKFIGGLTGKAVGAIAAPAFVNYLGAAAVPLTGAVGTVVVVGGYYVVSTAISSFSSAPSPDAASSSTEATADAASSSTASPVDESEDSKPDALSSEMDGFVIINDYVNKPELCQEKIKGG